MMNYYSNNTDQYMSFVNYPHAANQSNDYDRLQCNQKSNAGYARGYQFPNASLYPHQSYCDANQPRPDWTTNTQPCLGSGTNSQPCLDTGLNPQPCLGAGLNIQSNVSLDLSDVPQTLTSPLKGGTHRNLRVKKVKVPVRPQYCDMCRCTLNSQSQADAHYRGQQHQRLANKNKMPTNQGGGALINDGITSDARQEAVGHKGELETSPEPSVANHNKELLSGNYIDSDQLVVVDSCEDANTEEPRQKKRKIVPSIPCEVCSLVFNSDSQASAHFLGSRHLKKIRLLQLEHAESFPSPLAGSMDPSRKMRHHCQLCNVQLNSSSQFNQHCLGQGHLKKVHEFSDPKSEVPGNRSGWLYCRTCDISCRTAPGLQNHVLSLAHRENALAGRDVHVPGAILGKDGH